MSQLCLFCRASSGKQASTKACPIGQLRKKDLSRPDKSLENMRKIDFFLVFFVVFSTFLVWFFDFFYKKNVSDRPTHFLHLPKTWPTQIFVIFLPNAECIIMHTCDQHARTMNGHFSTPCLYGNSQFSYDGSACTPVHHCRLTNEETWNAVWVEFFPYMCFMWCCCIHVPHPQHSLDLSIVQGLEGSKLTYFLW